MPTQKIEHYWSYSDERHPYLMVEVDFNGSKRILKGLIDTGSTETIVSKEIASDYIDNIDTLEQFEIGGANGKSIMYKLKNKNIVRIDKLHRVESGFKMNLYTMVIGDETYKIDIILGLSFLKECQSFWIDAQSKTCKIEFYS